MDDRDGAAPIALARYAPVAQPVVHPPLAGAILLEAAGDLLLGLGDGHAVQEARMDHHRVGTLLLKIGFVADLEGLGFGTARRHHRYDVEPILAGKVEVALI